MRGVLRFFLKPTNIPQMPVPKVNGENGFLHTNHGNSGCNNVDEKMK